MKVLPAVVLAVIACLYILIAASNIFLLRQMREANTSDVLSATHELPQADFARFWYAGRLLRRQAAQHFGVTPAADPGLQRTLRLDLLSPAAPAETAWLYPPPMGLLAMLCSFLPLAWSFWAWRLASIVTAALLLRRAGLGWPVVAAGLASPAAWHDLLSGQTGTLTGGMLVASLLTVKTSPRLAGVLAGLLCIKPQMALALPAVLLHRRRWRALAAGLLAAGAINLLATLVEGWGSWVRFIGTTQPAASHVLTMPFHFPLFQAGFTVFLMARSLHAGLAASWCAQTLSSVVCLILLWLIWRGPGANPVARMAVTVSLSLLIMPYGFEYDLVGFSIAMAALAAQGDNRQWPLAALLWLFPGYLIFLTGLIGVILMPLAAAAGGLLAWRQCRDSNAANSPAWS